ncbi:MAG: carotenoid biosynthesis protein [Candidatus Uhrbacteria bacterium]|nr:carotenoid biosynthesis protein [Patescibacteria group bacterium]MBU1907393.1 carotenoid biosynthesis protein [Patescibacteria group bacterium]
MNLSPASILYASLVLVVAVLLAINPSLIMHQPVFLFGVALTAILIFYFLVRQIGFWQAMLLFILASLIGFIMEYLGVHDGKTFTPYSYTDFLGPQIYNIPILIPISWFTALTTAWMGARLIIGFGKRVSGLIIILVASLLAVVYDLPIEYMAMHVWNSWNWEQGGPLLSVPTLNFIGWFVTAFLVFGLGSRAWRQINPSYKAYTDLQVVCFSAFALLLWHTALNLLGFG